MKDQMDVGPLSRGVMLPKLNPYPPHYRMAFAFSILPFPHVHGLALRVAFPFGRRTGLPCSISVTSSGLGALCPPGVLLPLTRHCKGLVPTPLPFGSSLSAP